jgi:hypothetical protein
MVYANHQQMFMRYVGRRAARVSTYGSPRPFDQNIAKERPVVRPLSPSKHLFRLLY